MTSGRESTLRAILLRHFREKRGGLVIAFLCMLGVTVAELLKPWPLKLLFDNVLLGQPPSAGFEFLQPLLAKGQMHAVLVLSSFVVVIALAAAGLAYLQTFITAKISYQFTHRLRSELFSRLQQLSLSFHHQSKSGELLTKVASDTRALKDLLADWSLTMIANILTLLGMITIMLLMNWKLSLFALATLPLLIAIFVRIGTKIRKNVRQQRRFEGQLASTVGEVLGSITLVQAFGRTSFEQRQFENTSERTLEFALRSARISSAVTRAITPITSIGIAATLAVGSMEVIAGRMTPGDLLVFVAYVRNLYKPIRHVGKLSAKCARALVSGERIGQILALEPEIRDPVDAISVRRLDGDILFDNVSFSYRANTRAVEAVSFHIRPGEQVAVVGRSGAGKSTILSLLLRLYDPQTGTISIDGVDVRRYQRESLRHAIGIVLQDTLLFGATVAENLSYGKPDASHAELVAAAHDAEAHEFINALPNGYDTVVGERGALLSRGQCQRLCLARALVKKPSILVLDEPTSAIDPISERAIHEAVQRVHAARTLLVITHRYVSMERFDRILVLMNGRLVESGTHHELLAANGYYSELLSQHVKSPAIDIQALIA